MEVILLERVAKLGQMGEIVRVKDGFARNYLLPQKKALRATDANKKVFEGKRAQLEANNLERRKDADSVGKKLDGQSFVMIRSAGESGVLYGSVSTRDLADVLGTAGFTLNRNQLVMNHPIKTLGLHKIPVHLHPEVEVSVTINIARSEDEAERQARGENVTLHEKDDINDLGLEIGAALAEAGPHAEM